MRRIQISGYKSLKDIDIDLAPLVVLFGPNASGKSNFIDALQILGRLVSRSTLSDALSEPLRGYPIEQFAFPQGGLEALLSRERADFTISAEFETGRPRTPYRYGVTVGIRPASGVLTVSAESLILLKNRGDAEEKPAIGIERIEDRIRIRRKNRLDAPHRVTIGVNHTILSDNRFRAPEYPHIEQCREALSSWKTYYLDPRVSMRRAATPTDVSDIGALGEMLGPFLYKLRAEKSAHFNSVVRTLKSLIPNIEDLSVDLDKKRGVLDIQVRQDGMEYSNRIISEGTLRVISLCSIAVNPWRGDLVAFEEPENGVHPRRIELIAELLTALVREQGRQVIITTHSPLLCEAFIRKQKEHPGQILLMKVDSESGGTRISPFDPEGSLLQDQQIKEALNGAGENGLFESLLLRGLIDG